MTTLAVAPLWTTASSFDLLRQTTVLPIAIGRPGRSLPGGRLLRSLLAQLSIDESYALSVRAGAPGRPDGKALLVTGACLYVVWILGTSIGAVLGPVLGDPKRLGLDAAFPAGFVALLWPMLSGRHAVRCAIGGAVAALLLAPFTPPGIPLAGAAVVGLWLAR